MRLIDADALKAEFTGNFHEMWHYTGIRAMIDVQPTVDAVEVVHGRWLYEAHKETTNYRWNVTAECSECCDEEKEVWAGFFPNVPDWLAKDVALDSAKSVKLSNYCPNCGAKMDGVQGGSCGQKEDESSPPARNDGGYQSSEDRCDNRGHATDDIPDALYSH